MTDSIIVMYGTTWCVACRRARLFLDQKNISYRWVDIDQDLEGEEFVKQTNKGMRSVPTIVFQDGSILVEPSTKKLADKLGVSLY